jgi:hypothetical protein
MGAQRLPLRTPEERASLEQAGLGVRVARGRQARAQASFLS